MRRARKKTVAASRPGRGAKVRLALPAATEEGRRWGTLLMDELRSWPEVTVKPMFGMQGAWRGRRMFAAAPRTRAPGSPQNIMFKLRGAPAKVLERAHRDPRIRLDPATKQCWASFALASDHDLHDVLVWLEQAWRLAAAAA